MERHRDNGPIHEHELASQLHLPLHACDSFFQTVRGSKLLVAMAHEGQAEAALQLELDYRREWKAKEGAMARTEKVRQR